MAHYDQNQKEVTKRGTSAQRRPLRGLRSIPFGNPGPSDRNHRNRQVSSNSGLTMTIWSRMTTETCKGPHQTAAGL